jgi:monothiol glutaredoxin
VEETAPLIKAYLNPYCPWSPGVRSVLDNAGLAYEMLDITQNRQAFEEMVEKSRQYSSPCVEINGQMLADVGGDEVEDWLRQHGLV